ncbi:MAG: peptidoglycan-binding protein [Siculibacillus sp.]|nr:peptidoglycan-binding protein [Siculibacillus sp.]
MARPVRSSDPDWSDRDLGFDDRDGARRVPGSLPIRVAELAMRNPVTTGGVVVSIVMVLVTVANAIANQPVRHPHPFFETRPVARAEARPIGQTPALPAAVQSGSPAGNGLPAVLPRPKPVSSIEDDLVRELQSVLAERGFYAGSIDGRIGPATAEAIKAFERRIGTSPTGEASELLLAALKAAPGIVAPVTVTQSAPVAPQSAPRAVTTSPRNIAPPPVPPRPVAGQPAPAAQVVQASVVPTPSMRVATADAVAYPAGREEIESAEVDVPVFTGSIRRAAREPLAPGGDEKLQKLQRALISAGYGPLKADGRWDERSTSAVRRYEADRGWQVTGRPSEKLVWDLMPKSAQARR